EPGRPRPLRPLARGRRRRAVRRRRRLLLSCAVVRRDRAARAPELHHPHQRSDRGVPQALTRPMDSGLAGFKDLLKEFRGLSAWTVGAGVAVPFAAALASLAPPWPPGVVLVTAVVELVALVFVYQFLKLARRRTINWVLSISAAVLVPAGIAYLVGLSLYTY